MSFDCFGESGWLFGLVIIVIGGVIVCYFFGNLFGLGVVGGVIVGFGWLFMGSVIGVLIGVVVGFFVVLLGFDLLFSGLVGGGCGGCFGGGGFGGGGGLGGGGGVLGRW